uniref:DUF4774 domain-containing protein n=1 Tax=Parastrongyloides trichosuri TaxID=131310 RepID=A0A0N4ZYJ6_PARTI
MYKVTIISLLFTSCLQEKQLPSLKDIEDYNDPILKEIFRKSFTTNSPYYKNTDNTQQGTNYQQQYMKNQPTYKENQGHFPQPINEQATNQNIVYIPNDMAILANTGYNVFINGARQFQAVIPSALTNGALALFG